MIVELERDAPYGWKVDAARLRRNQQPSADTMRHLAAELAGVGELFFPPPAASEDEDEELEFAMPRLRLRGGG